MNPKHLLTLLVLFLFPAVLRAQDARGMAVGGAATAAPLGVFGLYWNPALEAVDSNTWTLASGYSAFTTSNTNSAILRFTPTAAIQSGQDPVSQYQQYSGSFMAKYSNFTFGVFYDDEETLNASQGALGLFNDRAAGTLASTAYALNYLQTTQQIETLVLSYSTPLPLGTFPFLSVGGSLKYHYGTQYEQTNLTGAYTEGSSTGYAYSRITSSSGLGLSMDLGLFAKISDMLNVGYMMQNIQSSFNWQAQQQNYTLDPVTGQDVASGAASSVTINAPFPYTTKLGVSLAPPDKNTYLEGEVSWVNGQTFWRGGIEKYYNNGMVIRFGTFSDQVSGQELWSFGFGYFRPNFNVDIACVTRSIPDLQNSIALGGGVDAAVRF